MLEEEEGAQGRGGWVGGSSPQGAATTQPSARRGGRRSTPAVACRRLLLIQGALAGGQRACLSCAHLAAHPPSWPPARCRHQGRDGHRRAHPGQRHSHGPDAVGGTGSRGSGASQGQGACQVRMIGLQDGGLDACPEGNCSRRGHRQQKQHYHCPASCTCHRNSLGCLCIECFRQFHCAWLSVPGWTCWVTGRKRVSINTS